MSTRNLLISVDDSDGCEAAVQWVMSNVYKAGTDTIHVIHVIPRLQPSISHGAPPIDFIPYNDPASYDTMISDAERWITKRVLSHMKNVTPKAVVHIIKYEVDNDSIGNVICKKADELDAALVVMARHNKSKLQEVCRLCKELRKNFSCSTMFLSIVSLQFFLGSVTNFCLAHCSQPVLVMG